jgi:D-threonate/D-erythronate kinase
MPKVQLLVLADDMTGALEVGAIFGGVRIDCVVSTVPLQEPVPDVIVIDTETRHCTPSGAVERITQCLGNWGLQADLLYKKTDSTLRGNIGSELAAIHALYPNLRIGYAPAYPRHGRTVTNGIVYLQGVPVSETSFAHDELNPVLTSSVSELIGDHTPYVIFDGTTDSDVLRAAETMLRDPAIGILAGPAALGWALAKLLCQDNPLPVSLPHVRTCLVLNGSRTDCSKSQLSHAHQAGCIMRYPDSPWSWTDSDLTQVASPPAVAVERAEHLIRLIGRRKDDGVFIIGGDTVFAFISALGNPPLIPVAEAVPGVAVSRILRKDLCRRLPHRDGDLILISKAGGFGDVDVICKVRRILDQNAG